jgi:hypothetical protein
LHKVVAVALATGALALCSGNLRAQPSITAIANVSDVGLSVIDVQDLQFGTVTPGAATFLDPQVSANAGKFEIRGAQRAEIAVDITLPVALTVGPWSMPISFGANAACHRNRDQQAQCTYFDPSTTLITNIRNRNFPDNLRMIWIGGTVTPPAAQFPGVYRGSVTLTVAYTGN